MDNNSKVKVLIALVLYAQSSIAQSVLPSYSNFNQIKCPSTESCTSVTTKSEIKMSCPQLSIALSWDRLSDQYAKGPSISINCFDLDVYYLRHDVYDIPACEYFKNGPLKVFNVIRISGCPLPITKSIKSAFKIFENGSVNSLELYSRSDLNRQHFTGLDDLEQLSLKENGIFDLPEDVFNDLTNLKKLDLSFNRLNFTNNIFANLVNLEHLNIGHNNLEVLEKGAFRNQKRLENLDLQRNKLEKLSKQTFEDLSSLTHLDLSSNLIKSFQPEVFSPLTNLLDLKLDENPFESFPANLFENNKKINKLSIFMENPVPMETLPSGFLSNLTDLELVTICCGLSSVPEDLLKGSLNLVSIKFCKNRLTTLPVKLFANQTKLYELDLSENKFKSLPDGLLADTHDLTFLILFFNQLENISRLLFTLLDSSNAKTAIKHIDLRNNKVKNLTSILQAVIHPNLKKIDLSYNEIAKVDLIELENSIPAEMDVEVYIQNNPIYCNCDILQFNKFLRNELPPRINIFKLIPGNLTCAGPENLVGKQLKHVEPIELLCSLKPSNSSDENCPSECSCMVRPADQTLLINCSNANLHEGPDFPRELLDKFEFIELNISYNRITKISSENIPNNLRVLDLSNNNLKEFDLMVLEEFNKREIKALRLSSNSWNCDCGTLSFLSFVENNSKLIKDLNEVRCSNGEVIANLSESDFCFIKPYLLVVIIAAVIFIGILIGMFIYYNMEIKVWLFANDMCLWWVSRKELEQDKRFDAFISHSDLDEDFVNDQLVPELENGTNPFILCRSESHWVASQTAIAVNESRTTIIILSTNFLKTIWNQTDLRAAHEEARFIFVIHKDLECIDDLDEELKGYLKEHVYIRWSDPLFWNKLRYALPHIRRRKENTNDELELIERNKNNV